MVTVKVLGAELCLKSCHSLAQLQVQLSQTSIFGLQIDDGIPLVIELALVERLRQLHLPVRLLQLSLQSHNQLRLFVAIPLYGASPVYVAPALGVL